MESTKLHFPLALTCEGWASSVTVTVDPSGHVADVAAGSPEGRPIKGIAVPAMANVHSHAHQRLMAGLAECAGPGADSFWTWRETMYGFVRRLGPEDLEAVAAQLYVEMLKSGYTAVGEFQYLHHQPDGEPYTNPAELSLRCLSAAEAAGIAITLLPALYVHGGFGGMPPGAGQLRFVSSLEQFLDIHARLAKACAREPLARLGVAPHSLRAATPAIIAEVINSIDPHSPIHIHVAEQEKEVADCLALAGRRPVELLLENFEVSKRWTAIHATHMTAAETRNLAGSGATAGLCPTTEANLGDGIFPGVEFLHRGGAIAIGSDSHITVSPAEELRLLEYSQRLRDLTRNALAGGPGRSTGRNLYDLACTGGARALAQPMGAIARGRRADIVVLDGEHPLLASRQGDQILDTWIFAGGNALVREVFVAGRPVVSAGRHFAEEAIADRFRATLRRLVA
jgi:formimidoylglutamate deiminase